MKIKSVNPHTIDVFTGMGWDNWTRFQIIKSQKKQFLKKIGGKSVPSEEMDTLRNMYKGDK
jgi:hypothetical protein